MDDILVGDGLVGVEEQFLNIFFEIFALDMQKQIARLVILHNYNLPLFIKMEQSAAK